MIRPSRKRNLILECVCLMLGAIGCSDPNSSSNKPTNNVPAHILGTDALVAELEAASSAISDTVDSIFKSINSGDVKELYDSATAPKFRQVAPLEKFQAMCERVQTRLGEIKSKQPANFDLNPINGGLIASASYQAEFENGSGTIFVVFEKLGDEWQLLRLNVNAPELLDDPSQFREKVELMVENSDPVMPGAMVDLLDLSTDPPSVLAENIQVLNVRWRTSDPPSLPEFPASGFATIACTKDELAAVKSAGKLSLRQHASDKSKPAKQN